MFSVSIVWWHFGVWRDDRGIGGWQSKHVACVVPLRIFSLLAFRVISIAASVTCNMPCIRMDSRLLNCRKNEENLSRTRSKHLLFLFFFDTSFIWSVRCSGIFILNHSQLECATIAQIDFRFDKWPMRSHSCRHHNATLWMYYRASV